jgi:hypothetical protein
MSASCAIEEEIAGGSDSDMASGGRRVELLKKGKGEKSWA